MQQQAEMIQNLQRQQHGRIIDLELNEFKDEGLNIDQGNLGNGGNKHGDNGVEDLPMGVPRGGEPEPRGNAQSQPIWREYLGESLCKMKPPSFEDLLTLLMMKNGCLLWKPFWIL